MEIERAKYLLKCYLRARISKIERHVLYVVEKDQSSLMSAAEMEFAFKLYEARKNHLQESFLKTMPQKLNFLNNDEIDDRYSKCLPLTCSHGPQPRRNGLHPDPRAVRRPLQRDPAHPGRVQTRPSVLPALPRHQTAAGEGQRRVTLTKG